MRRDGVTLFMYRIALLVLFAIFIVTVWIIPPPICSDPRPKGLAVGTVLRLYGC
jgi:hypothetical protein